MRRRPRVHVLLERQGGTVTTLDRLRAAREVVRRWAGYYGPWWGMYMDLCVRIEEEKQ